MLPVNFLAIFVAAAASIALGFLWYGPFFGSQWMKLMNINKEDIQNAKKKGMSKTYALMVLGSLLMAYVLAHVILFGGAYLKTSGALSGMSGAFWTWIGFIVPMLMDAQLWENKPWKLFWINASYRFVSFMIMGAIIGAWV